jgi:1,4-alpha-glucan branching enzyme
VDSTWGKDKAFSTWDSPLVAEIAFAARSAELRTVAAAAGARAGDPGLERAARELLALQSSDWAFQVTHELAGDYPLRRVEEHTARLDEALAELARGTADASGAEPGVRGLAPGLDVSPLSGI